MQCSTRSSLRKGRGNSRTITSSQESIHPQLGRAIARLSCGTFRRPPAPHNRAAYAQLTSRLATHQGPLILDSGCGTGESTKRIAALHPDALVVGVDKSAIRIARGQKSSSSSHLNCLLLRADVVDIWLLAREDGLKLEKHYLLYQNPWPKPKHLRRRWYAHPALTVILELGGELIVRGNWRPYLADFAEVLHLVTGVRSQVAEIEVAEPITPFEEKYAMSDQKLYELRYGNSLR